MQQEPEVAFCDLCNTSVPLADLESGAAIRHGGNTVGACCLPALQRAPVAAAAVAVPSSPAPAGASSDNRLLTVAFVLLVAIAGATIYLEYRFNERVDGVRAATTAAVDQLDRSVRSQDDLLRGLDTGLAAAASQKQLDTLGKRLDGIDQSLGDERARQLLAAEKQQQAVDKLDARLLALSDARAEQKLLLGQLQTQLQQQSVTLAELRAMPRPAVKEASAEPAPAPVAAVPGLSPQLAHQVTRLADPDPATRFEAVDELLRSKEPLVREHLLPMTKDADTFVRRLTVEGLADFKHPSCVDALLVALADPEKIVADTAWRSLKKLTGQNLPFDVEASKDARARAQQRWQDWWDKNKMSFGS